MGTMKRMNEGSKNGNKQGFVWKKNVGPIIPCVWGDIDLASLRRAIDTVTRAGGAIMLGVTSDGGAYSICVLHGDQKIKEYPHTAAECEDLLAALADEFMDLIA